MSEEYDDIQHIPIKFKLRDKCGMCGRSRKETAELERRLGIAVERLQSMSSAPGSYPRQWFIATAEYALNEIRAKEGDEG
jgi:hypothetical protein